jgi:hypothetical protein
MSNSRKLNYRRFTSKYFDYDQDFKNLNFRDKPELYQVGKGEQGVLMVEPYKSEILPFWRFKNQEIATKSAKKIYSLFLEYKKQDDFVGMDMARKFLQMGYTRSRRYANHSSGRKYRTNPQLEKSREQELEKRKDILPQAIDALTNEKAQVARIFYGYYIKVIEDKIYKSKKVEWKQKYG